jgi:hypothetical protein
MCDVAGGNWTDLWQSRDGCGFKGRRYEYRRTLGVVRSFTHTPLDAPKIFYAQKIQPRASKDSSVTTVIGCMRRLKLLHMQALSRIASGLAIKMKTGQHASIGVGYGPIGRKYWTIWTRSFNLKEPIGRWHLRVVASLLQDARSRSSHA